MSKPFSQACENNKNFILEVIQRFFAPGDLVLEIGSGTGQHVRFFAEQLPHVCWLPSEMEENLDTLRAGLEGEDRPNLLAPLSLDVRQERWPLQNAHGIFSANCLHIMSEAAMVDFFRGVGKVLSQGGTLCVYGPFKYRGQFTTASNERFDLWLKERSPASGIRDFEKVDGLALQAGLELVADHPMPANNQLIVWQKSKQPEE